MGYGITSESQLIDYQTICNGCKSFADSAQVFRDTGSRVVDAGNECNAKALSVDGKSMQPDIVDAGNEISLLYKTYVEAANDVMQQAVNVYNEQVAELNEYNRRKAEERQRQQQQQQQNRRS